MALQMFTIPERKAQQAAKFNIAASHVCLTGSYNVMVMDLLGPSLEALACKHCVYEVWSSASQNVLVVACLAPSTLSSSVLSSLCSQWFAQIPPLVHDRSARTCLILVGGLSP